MISEEEKELCGIIKNEKINPCAMDHSIRPNWIDLSLNYNSLPIEKEIAIIVTSWHGHLMWLKNTLTNYRLTGAFVVCSYDNPFKCWNTNQAEADKLLPPPDIFLIPHSWVFKHVTYDNEKRVGWFWDVVYAFGILSQFKNLKYVFLVNGDCIWQKPEGMKDLILLLGDSDFMSVARERNTIHTCSMIFKYESLLKVINYFTENYVYPVLSFHSPEIILEEAVRVLQLNEKAAPEQPMELDGSSVDYYSRYSQNSTWKKLVGYRNLTAEYLTAAIERREPVERDLIDPRYYKYCATGGQMSLQKYYETGDRRYIYKLWDECADSWYDRLYFPISKYGDSPIYDREIEKERK